MKIPDFGVAHNLTLVKIRKTYPGQARKVMNALWGAGQMMFNKVLLVTDKDTDMDSREILLNKLHSLNPQRDLVFSEGPLDVLDHASEFTGFGGKLGIDLTEKLPEEMSAEPSDEYVDVLESVNPVAKILKKSFIYTENKDPLFCLMNIKKFDSYSPRSFRKQLIIEPELEPFPYLFFTDEGVSIDKLEEFLWYVLNNIEIRRDITILRLKDGKKKVLIDGSSKIMAQENFPREWPNIVTMSPEVINRIDENWKRLGLGEFITSPSSYYSSIRVTSGASVRKR
jgi:4-hydroxy-3-polyprenylbenzoate decarboxylase